MSILITGSTGQLGRELRKIMDHELITPTHQQLEITDPDAIKKIIGLKPEIIIHTAAFTDVDGCETNPELAWNVNSDGTRNISLAAKELNAKLIYISTDYVFDGNKGEPYLESDEPNPLNNYGRSKLTGENFVKDIAPRHFIIRTSWLYSKTGKNFVNTVLELAKVKQELRIVNDQVGSPTYAKDLARIIKSLMPIEAYGIYHASGEGECSWYEFTKQILNLVGSYHIKLLPITTSEFPRPAQRPAYSSLSNHQLEKVGLKMRPWRESLKDYFLTH